MPKSALEKAMDHLALRPLSACELRSKLAKSAQFSETEIEEALECCSRRGYLNDGLLAEDAAQFLNSCGKGARLIRRKLLSRGIDAEDISSALEKLSDEDERNAARSAAETKMRLLVREKDMRKKREKLFRFLISRGFSPSVTSGVISDIFSSQDEEFSPDFPES